MVSIQALREQRAALVKEARNQLDQKGDRVWAADDQKVFDERSDKIDSIELQISNLEKQIKREAEEGFKDVEQFRNNKGGKEPNEGRTLFAKLLRSGPQALTQDEFLKIRNTMSTTTAGEGGYTVESTVASQLIDLLKFYGGMRGVASQITTAQGNAMSYPKSDGTSETGEWIAENTTATDADISFGTVGLNAYKASSKVITIPFELLQDTSIDIIALVNNRIRTRIGRTMNAGFTTGTGSAQPNGFVTAASVGKAGATTQTTTIIYDDLVDLIESIDQAYQDDGTCKFMMSQSMRKVVRKLKDSAGRPLWADSYESGIKTGIPSQLMGHDVVINNDMAVPAASAKSLAFGDFSKYMIRDVMDITLFRFDDSVYAKKGQVGFMAWCRAGGNLLDTNAIKLYQHSAT